MMAAIISGGDGPTPKLPGAPAKAMRSGRATSARGMAVAKALGQPKGTVVSGGDTPKPFPKGATVISGGG